MKTLAKTRNFHIPLPDDIYLELKKLSASLKVPATQVARKALEEWLRERKKDSLRKEVNRYAIENAGSPEDLDPELEKAGLKLLKKVK